MACLASCEADVEFDTQYENGIAIYALATAGEPFSVRISRSFTVNDNPSVVFSHYSAYYNEIDSLYHSKVVIKDAVAQIVVNNKDKYELTYSDDSPYVYHCGYTPKAGDLISMSVQAPGYKDIQATTRVENPQQIEIIDTQVVYKDNGDDGSVVIDNPLDRFGVDSVMLITMKITDSPSSHNYYRLRVRGVADREESMLVSKRTFYSLSDIFTSNDIIFLDSQLTKPFGDWEAGMSNVFDDHLFNGQEYTFTVETRKRYGDNARVIVELQTISQDLYYFLKSYMLFRISTDDVYLTPIGLYSNITHGWGIMGSVSYDRHLIYY